MWTIQQRLKTGLHLVCMSPGIRGKINTLRQLSKVALRSRYKFKLGDTSEEVSANAWADYHLLRFVSRDMNVRIHCDLSPRAWFLVPDLDAKMVFGGYIALFQFIKFMQALGIQTGILALKPLPDRTVLLQSFEGNNMAHEVLTSAQIETVGTGRTVRLGAGDMLVSYNWTSSLVAARMARFLDDPAYYYFVQEDERIFYQNDSYRFLCESIFHDEPRLRMICNSQKLYEHFLDQGLARPDQVAGIFEQALPPAELPDGKTLASRLPRRFVFYGRPEDHAKRNLMTIALLALAKAKRTRVFDAEPWEFFMIGSSSMGDSFDLEGTTITCLPNQGYETYRRTLATFDLGMCLMYAPHPSVPPYEMVRSGVVTVVNTTRERPAEWYRAISGNFEPGKPTVDELANAIGRAAARVGDTNARLTQLHTYHPATWQESFSHLPDVLRHSIFDQVQRKSAA